MNVLFNNDRLQKLTANLYTLTGIQTNIFDAAGNTVKLFGKHSSFCRIMNTNPEGHRRCEECDRRAVRECSATKKACSYRCHAGLMEVVIPIFDADEPVAYIAFGQMLDDSPRKFQWEQTFRLLQWYDGDMYELSQAFNQLEQRSLNVIESYSEVLKAVVSYIKLEGMIRSAELSDAQRIQLYIDEHYREKFSLKKMANDLHIGTTKLCSLAKSSTGMSITNLISIRRVEEAKKLLLREPLSIAAVSERVGFNDYNYFTKIFKKITCQTPSDYKKNCVRGSRHLH